MLGTPGWCARKLGRSGRSGWWTATRRTRDGQDGISYGNEGLHWWRLHWRWCLARITGSNLGRTSAHSAGCGGWRRWMSVSWWTSIGWSWWRRATVDGRGWVMRMLRRLLLGWPVVARWQRAGWRVWRNHERMTGKKLMRSTRWTAPSHLRSSSTVSSSAGRWRNSSKHYRIKYDLIKYTHIIRKQNKKPCYNNRLAINSLKGSTQVLQVFFSFPAK